jgi:peptidyl-prolyl cis-trans isomerase SurA
MVHRLTHLVLSGGPRPAPSSKPVGGPAAGEGARPTIILAERDIQQRDPKTARRRSGYARTTNPARDRAVPAARQIIGEIQRAENVEQASNDADAGKMMTVDRHYNEDSLMIILRWAAIAALVGGCLAALGCKTAAAPDVAASVNGRPIYYSDVDKAYKSQFPGRVEGESEDQVQLRRLEVLRSLIDTELMLQRAEKGGLVATDADVEARLNELKTPYTKEEFDKQLKEWGLKLDELKARVRRDESVKKLFNKDITSKINITDADVANFYNANRGSFNLPEPRVHLAQILVTPQADPNVHNLKNDKAKNDEESKRKIQAIESRLRQGEDFAMVAQNYSEDPATIPNGGDLGFLPESSLDKTSPDLRKLVLSLQPGQLSPVIKTQEGYRILKMISKEPAGQRDLSDPRVQQSIRQTLLDRKDQLLKTAYYEVARNEAKIVNNMSKTVFADAAKSEK